jgi:hypothetical protein
MLKVITNNVDSDTEDDKVTEIIKNKRGRPKKTDQNTISKYTIKKKNTYPHREIKKTYLIILKINNEDIKVYKINTNNENNRNKNNINNINGINIFNDYKNNINDYKNNEYKNNDMNILINDFYNTKIVPLFVGNIPIKLFDKNLSEEDSQNINCSKEYIRNTTEFICPLLKNNNGHEWPQKSPYLCFNCSCNFSGSPLGVPVRIYKDIIYCEGNICDFGCLLRYMYDTLDIKDFIERYPLVCAMYWMIYGINMDNNDIKMALPKTMLSKFGGTLSDIEYHDFHKINSDRLVEVYQLPFVPSLLRIYDVKVSTNPTIIFNKDIKKKKLEIKEKPYIPIDMDKLQQAKSNILRLKKICI